MARVKGASRATKNSDRVYLPSMAGNVDYSRRRAVVSGLRGQNKRDNV